MLQKPLFSALLLSVLTYTSIAQDNTPKYSNEFLSIGVGARALGMSNAFIATCDDVTGGYWNPAALLNVKGDMQVGLMHASYFANIAKYDYGSMVKSIDQKSSAAFSIIRFGVDDIPNTTELIDGQGNIDYDKVTTFSAADYAFIFSYARKSKIEGLNLGGNAKIIHRKVGDFGKAWGFGLDASITYTKNKWRFAAVGRDITTTFNAWSYNLSETTKETFTATGNDIPKNSLEITLPKLLTGAAYTTKIKKHFSLTGELDMDFTFDGQRNVLISAKPVSVDPHAGLEAGYKGIVFLRGGIGNIQRIKRIEGGENLNVQPNFGIGVKIKIFSIDYAFTDVGNVSEALYSNIFSLKIDISKPTGKSSL
jgi:hypothetical protein